MILRRRAGAGWASALAGYTGAAIIGLIAGDTPGEWLVLLLRQTAVLVAIQVFAILLGRTWREVAVLREEERARMTAIKLREASVKRRWVDAERIRSLATPTLQRIAAGEESPELRREAMLLEGALRDMLRGRRLAAGAVPTAAREARARGVDVVLLDDLGDEAGPLPYAVLSTVQEWAAERLSNTAPPQATVRLAVGADRRLTVSFYAEHSGDGPEVLTLDPLGARPPL